MTLDAPDFIEEIPAWRSWHADDIGYGGAARLRSLRGKAVWPAEGLQAVCPTVFACPEPPGEECSCGIYAANSFNQLYEMGYTTNDVCGEIGLWGKVIPAEWGYRAEWAKVVKLYVPHLHWRLAGPLRETYQVPVLLKNPFRKEEED